MTHRQQPKTRRDGWTPERRTRFLELLAAGIDVRRACTEIGMSRRGAYKLRRRDAAFALAWDSALRAARHAARAEFLEMLPESLRRTMSELSGECELRAAGTALRDAVRVVAGV